MKIKSLLMLIILGFTGCIGVIERPVAPLPAVIVEPTYKVVIVNGVPVRRIIVVPQPIVIHRHHH